MTSREAFEQWHKSQYQGYNSYSYKHDTTAYIDDHVEIAFMAWQASQAQQASEIEALKHDLYSYMKASNGYVNELMKQAQTIAELVEALDIAKDILEAHTLTHVYDALIAKAKGK